MQKKVKLNTCLKSYVKINSEWICDPYVRPKTTKFLEESIEQKPHDVGFGNNFSDMIPKGQMKYKKHVHQKTLPTW